MTLRETKTILSLVKFIDWKFLVERSRGERYLVIEFAARCTATGAVKSQRSRKWRLSRHMTRGELVQSALLAVLVVGEHEAREQFLYRGSAIFGPHFNVDALHELCQVPKGLDKR